MNTFMDFDIPTEGGKFTGAHAVCGGVGAPGPVSSIEDGVTECQWRGSYETLSESQMEVQLGYGSAYPAFQFVEDQSGSQRLMRIAMSVNMNQWDLIYPAMVEKYGRPTVHRETVQNGLGGTFPKITARWSNGASSIEMEQRCVGKLNIMCINYNHTALVNMHQSRSGLTAHF